MPSSSMSLWRPRARLYMPPFTYQSPNPNWTWDMMFRTAGASNGEDPTYFEMVKGLPQVRVGHPPTDTLVAWYGNSQGHGGN